MVCVCWETANEALELLPTHSLTKGGWIWGCWSSWCHLSGGGDIPPLGLLADIKMPSVCLLLNNVKLCCVTAAGLAFQLEQGGSCSFITNLLKIGNGIILLIQETFPGAPDKLSFNLLFYFARGLYLLCKASLLISINFV